ncbi:flagellar motor protein MotP [Priestia megaterium]|uniref:flagellar motor protein MotP n=1 Tax=Priestia megaterium TaxID=1404 RepID=UPI000BF57554|nr:flagellar motor protein MotP [Priestia megaterium]MED3867522.1 flagellar motor protein MotP [Priestia megaterium]PER77219.1 motility protein A [Priestia megaterium]PFP39585.1 motility protein A [Priestia megaterium]
MKKIDMLTPIGILIGISMVVFGVISSGGMSGFLAFIDVPSILIVLGGVFGTLCVSFPLKQLKNMGKVGKQAFQSKEINVEEIVGTFVHLSEKARREGLLSLEAELEQIDDLFVKKGILLAIDGVEPEMIRELLEAEIAALEERHARGRSMFEKAGDYAPALGMIGTLVGLVLMLKSLNTPSSLGPNMAIALLTTFYGALLSNLFFQPIAAKLVGKTEHELFVKEVIIEGAIGLQAGQNSRFVQAKLKVFAPVEKRKLEEKREHVREA